MAFDLINDGDPGLDAREKINAVITRLNQKITYVATISQVSTNAPTVDFVAENLFGDLNAVLTYGYVSPGRYSIIASAPVVMGGGHWTGPFIKERFIPISSNNFFNLEWVSETQIDMVCFFPSNDQLDKTPIKFEIYAPNE